MKNITNFRRKSTKCLTNLFKFFKKKLTENKNKNGVEKKNPATGPGQQVQGVGSVARQHCEILRSRIIDPNEDGCRPEKASQS
jgi:hypothetical protein